MKKLLTALVALGLLGGLILFTTLRNPNDKLISPVVLGSRIANNLWFPQAEASFFGSQDLQISARAAYFVDIDTGKVFYQKDIYDRMPVASLVKIMTVVVALENKSWDDAVTVSYRASQMEPDRMDLRSGEKLTVEELLDGVFLVSANDGAEALADTAVEGSRENFLVQMNAKAKQLGMKDTLFINPTGLEEEGRQQYSSAFDVMLMARYAIKNFPRLLDITKNPHIQLPQTTAHQDYDLYSGINLLTTYPGVIGFKTGYTPEAGLTLVTLAEREGHRVLGVLLNSPDRRAEARELLDYSFKQLGVN